MLRTVLSLVVVLMLSAAATAGAAEKLKALVIDGQNNHNWKATTPVIKKAMESSGRFTVDVATSPSRGKDMSTFNPEFSKYDVVVSNYNGAMWSKKTQQAFLDSMIFR